MGAKSGTKKVHRSAVTGRFVSKKYVEKHPKTTVTESIKIKRRKGKS